MAEEKDPCADNAIKAVVALLETNPFSVEFRVKKKPQGINVLVEVTQEEMDRITKHVINKSKRIEKEEKSDDRS